MNTTYKQVKKAICLASVAMILLFAFTAMALAQGGGRYAVDPWSFGVHGDTQWTVSADPTGENPDHVSAAIANALNQQFISQGVDFVIQVGDLT